MAYNIIMNELSQLLGQRIKVLRKSKNLLQSELAGKINVEPKYLSRLETGLSSPSLKTLEKLANALDVEIKSLFDFPIQETKDGIMKKLIFKINSYSEDELRLLFMLTKVVDKEL